MMDMRPDVMRASRFRPGVLSMLTNPFHLARREPYGGIAAIAPRFEGRLLDVGCGACPYRDLFRKITHYTGLEIDTPAARALGRADAFYDGKELPFPDASCDVVLCSQVLEHVFDPAAFLAELRRVLTDSGTLILTVPLLWDEHEQPHDYGRYTSFGLAHLLGQAGFGILEHRKLTAGSAALVQLASALVHKRLGRIVGRRTAAVVGSLVYAPLNTLGELLLLRRLRDADLYLDNLVVAVPVTNGQGAP
jgi:SAM-dependent methyltransferase